MTELCPDCPLPTCIADIESKNATRFRSISLGWLRFLKTINESAEPHSYTGAKKLTVADEVGETITGAEITVCCQEAAQEDVTEFTNAAGDVLGCHYWLGALSESDEGGNIVGIVPYNSLIYGRLTKQEDGSYIHTEF